MKAYEELKNYLKEIKYLEDISCLLYWDQDVNMPEGNTDYRNEQFEYVSNKIDEMNRSPKYKKLLEKVLNLKKLGVGDKLNIQYLLDDFNDLAKMPPELSKAETKYMVKGLDLWQKAKESNSKEDIEKYKENLQHLIDIKRKQAACYDMKPYDYCLDAFDEGATTEKLDTFFTELKEGLMNILKDINTGGELKPTRKVKEADLEINAKMIAEKLGADSSWLKFGKTVHPYQITLGPSDKRIAMNEEPMYDFLHTLAHEIGHARYEHTMSIMGGDLPGTAKSSIYSFALHESQSLFFENHIVKNDAFINSLGSDSFKEILRHNNSVLRPSITRLESDELTYQLHIIIRYEIEKMLLAGEISLDDVRNVWANKYEKTFGLYPEKESEGWLQDCHWSDGSFGYFPCYTIGHAIAAQLRAKMGDIGYEDQIRWLVTNFQLHASMYTTDKLMKITTGESLNAKYLISHLRKRFVK